MLFVYLFVYFLKLYRVQQARQHQSEPYNKACVPACLQTALVVIFHHNDESSGGGSN